MFDFIIDRQQEISLLKFAKIEAQCNKHNIAEARKLEPIYKSDGTIHKTKTKERIIIINRWIKEQKKLKHFFTTHQYEGNPNDWNRYKLRRGVSNNRRGIEDLFSSGDK